MMLIVIARTRNSPKRPISKNFEFCFNEMTSLWWWLLTLSVEINHLSQGFFLFVMKNTRCYSRHYHHKFTWGTRGSVFTRSNVKRCQYLMYNVVCTLIFGWYFTNCVVYAHCIPHNWPLAAIAVVNWNKLLIVIGQRSLARCICECYDVWCNLRCKNIISMWMEWMNEIECEELQKKVIIIDRGFWFHAHTLWHDLTRFDSIRIASIAIDPMHTNRQTLIFHFCFRVLSARFIALSKWCTIDFSIVVRLCFKTKRGINLIKCAMHTIAPLHKFGSFDLIWYPPPVMDFKTKKK